MSTVDKQKVKQEMETPQKGTSVDYCLECAEKHLQTTTILLKEALQRYETCHKQNPTTQVCISNESVLEKIRNAVAELTGAEDDTNPMTDKPFIKDINTQVRNIRREIWNKKLAFGKGSPEDLQQIHQQTEQLINYIYQTYTQQTYTDEIQQIITEEQPQIDKAIQEAMRVQQQEKQQKPKKKKSTKKLIQELSIPTPQEEAEALYKGMIKKYTNVYTPHTSQKRDTPSETNEEE